ncbi:MAG: glycosyltransferase family 1 protein [Desulfobacteraceae bacterium]|nr:MAG: glycosyltransferase family 1 protein [Desulfobacteraceae bacterium]
MLKLAIIVKSFLLTGGSERHTVEVTRRLLGKGHQIDLYARFASPDLSNGINIHHIPDKWKFSSVLNSVSFALEADAALKGKKYDVIHSNERGFRQDVLTIHSFSYKGSFRRFSSFRKITRRYLSPRSLLYLWLEKKQMDSPYLVAVSDLIREDIAANYGRSEALDVIPPGVDIDYFNPGSLIRYRKPVRDKLGIQSGDIVLLFIGSEFKRKGLDDLLAVIAPPMRLLVVGQGDRLNHYQRLAGELGISERVHFLGLCQDVRQYIAASDIVVLPSLSDAFGMSILEAMSCAKPVVVSARAGVSMLIENSVNGFVFKDKRELPEILEVLYDPYRRDSAGGNARKTAEFHSWKKTADAYERLFYKTAETKRG